MKRLQNLSCRSLVGLTVVVCVAGVAQAGRPRAWPKAPPRPIPTPSAQQQLPIPSQFVPVQAQVSPGQDRWPVQTAAAVTSPARQSPRQVDAPTSLPSVQQQTPIQSQFVPIQAQVSPVQSQWPMVLEPAAELPPSEASTDDAPLPPLASEPAPSTGVPEAPPASDDSASSFRAAPSVMTDRPDGSAMSRRPVAPAPSRPTVPPAARPRQPSAARTPASVLVPRSNANTPPTPAPAASRRAAESVPSRSEAPLAPRPEEPSAAHGAAVINFDNQSGQPALVRLVGRTRAEVFVANGQRNTMQDIATGRYMIRVCYGTPGTYRFAEGQSFDVAGSAPRSSDVSITLHPATSGNYQMHEIPAADFVAATP